MIARQIAYGGNLAAAGTTLSLPASGAGSISQDTSLGSLLLLGVSAFGGTGTSVTTPAGWTLVGVVENRLTSVVTALFKQENAAVITAGTVISVTLGASVLGEIFFAEYPGMTATNAIDRITQANGSSQTADTGATLGASSPNEVAFGLVGCANAPTAADLGGNTTGYTLLVEQHSSAKGTTANTAAIYEKQLVNAGDSSQLTVPITGGVSRAWCATAVTLTKSTTPPVNTDTGAVHVWPSFQIGPALTGAAAPGYAPKIDAATGQIGLPGTTDKYGGQAGVLVTDNANLAPAAAGGGLLVYLKSVQYQPSSGSNPLGFPESWFAHSVKSSDPTFGAGTRVQVGTTNVYVMQPDSTANWTDTTGAIGTVGAVYAGFQAYRVQEAKHAMTVWDAQYAPTPAHVAGGAWLDSAGSSSVLGQVDPSTGVAYTWNGSTPQWKPLVNTLVSAVVSAMHAAGYIVWANGLASNPQLGTESDGGMVENFILNSTTPGAFPGGAPTDAQMVADIDACINAQLAGNGAQGLSTSTGSLSAAQKEVQRRFVVACYCLANRGKMYLQFNPDTTQGDWAIAQGPSFAIALGAPTETQNSAELYRVVTGTHGGYLYERDYTKGVVLLNSDPVDTLHVTLTRSDLKDLDGNAVPAGSYAVAPKTASILQATGAIAAPTNTTPPVQSGPGKSGGDTQTTTSDPIADWTGGPTLTYQWSNSPHGAGTWTPIAEATAATYNPVQADQGLDLKCTVTGTNAGGAVSADSNVVGPILPHEPVNLVVPHLSGGQQQGQTMTTDDGTWNSDGAALTITSRTWQRSFDLGNSWTTIGGASGPTYALQLQDVGGIVASMIGATNGGGTTFQRSAPTGVVAANPPASSPANPPLAPKTSVGWPNGWVTPTT